MSRRGPRQGDAELPTLPRGDPAHRADAGSERRLADLQLEKEFGIRGDGRIIEMAAPEAAGPSATTDVAAASTGMAGLTDSDRDFEQRTTSARAAAPEAGTTAAPLAGAPAATPPSGPLEAIALYDRLLVEYFRPRKIALRGCQPSALIEQALALAEYLDLERRLTFELLTEARNSYFVDDRELPTEYA